MDPFTKYFSRDFQARGDMIRNELLLIWKKISPDVGPSVFPYNDLAVYATNGILTQQQLQETHDALVATLARYQLLFGRTNLPLNYLIEKYRDQLARV